MEGWIYIIVWIVALWLIAGLILWGISKFPGDPVIYNIVRVVVIVVGGIATILLILRMFGIALPGPH